MLKAIIFDFNGIILDDEPLHFRSMRDAVSALGLHITMEEYWTRYLPFDDEACLDAICASHGVRITPSQRDVTLKNKSEYYHQMLQDRYPLFPGAADFVHASARRYPLAIASGARRPDIERTLQVTGLDECFHVIVAAEDFTLGKPHPESFLLALRRLNDQLNGTSSPVQPGECLVVEDSIGGVQGVLAAGMICLAVSNTYPAERLQDAHRVVASLEGLDPARLQSLFPNPS